MYLGAWEERGHNVYRLVGNNTIYVLREGLQTFTIPEGQRIAVKKEHFVGVHLDRRCTDGLVSYSTDTQHDCVNLGIFEDDVTRHGGLLSITHSHRKRTVSVRAHVSSGMHFPFIHARFMD